MLTSRNQGVKTHTSAIMKAPSAPLADTLTPYSFSILATTPPTS